MSLCLRERETISHRAAKIAEGGRGYVDEFLVSLRLRERKDGISQRHKDHGERERTMTENEIGAIVVDCAVALHKETGPGLWETVYEVVLA